jgi:hypothetical protein
VNPNYLFVAQRAEHRCEYCHALEVVFNIAFEVEHIIPLSKQGADEAQNWALSCRICNLRKSAYTDGIDPLTQQTVRLFNPRRDLWDEHFTVEQESSSYLKGKTMIGRATVERLKMNSSLQLRARELWLKLGIF